MLGGIRDTHGAGGRQLLDAAWRLNQQIEQFQSMRICNRLCHLADDLKEMIFGKPVHDQLLNRFIEYMGVSIRYTEQPVKTGIQILQERLRDPAIRNAL